MKRMKKLIAALMAVAMIASLNISAFAQQSAQTLTGGTASNGVTGGAIGTYTTDNGFTASAATPADTGKGSVVSNVGYEGKMPEGAVHIVMPTVAAGTFDMLLDPNDLIGEVAKGGESATQRISGITANSDYVYFANAADPEANKEAGWSSTSDSLKITNKGYWPLDVKLTAEVQKGDSAAAGSLIQLVDAKSKLTADADYPAMYMEVTSGTNKGVVKDGFGTPDMTISAGTAASPKLIVGNPIFTWDATNGGLNRDRKILNKALSYVKLVVASGAPTGSSTANTITALFKGDTAVQGLYTGSSGSETAANAATFKTAADGSKVNADGVIEITIAASSTAADKFDLSDGKAQAVGVYNIQMKKPGDSTAKTYATIKIAIDPVVANKYTPAANGVDAVIPQSEITFVESKASNTGSTSTIALKAAENAYVVTYSSTKYVKTLTEAAKANDYAWPSLSFNISAAINKTIAWDDLASTSGNGAEYNVNQVTGLNTKVIWDVANNYDGDTTIRTKPSVKVLKYAVNVGDSIEFKVNFGKGSNAAIAIIGLDAGASKAIVPTYGPTAAADTAAVANKYAAVKEGKIAEYNNKDGKWQTFDNSTGYGTATANNQLFQCSPKTVSDGAKATLTYLKADLTTATIEFTYGAANA